MDAASYTYVLVDTGTNQVWAAANKFPVKVGDVVSVPYSEPMVNFRSKSLNREFPMIYFADSIQVAGANAAAGKLPEGHPPIGGTAASGLPEGHPVVAAKTPPAAIDFTGLKPAKDGKTIEQIYAASSKLAGKSVKVRGKVVKYNPGILGWNFVHIQDGSGDAAAGDNDLIVTTRAETAVGNTVVMTGDIVLDKDFGAGYSYPVLLEDASITTE